MKKSSKNRLMPLHRELFTQDTLFDRIARAVCQAGVLPRKELYEAWETARRVRRRFRGGRVVDLACGHGLLAHVMMLLDRSSSTAMAVDTAIPKNADRLSKAMVAEWPKLQGRVTFCRSDLNEIALYPDDIVVSAHACGSLTDNIIDRAVAAGARLAVLPCCHDLKSCDDGGLSPWMTPGLAVDSVRVLGLKSRGYQVHVSRIPGGITPKNRLIMGAPLTL